MLPIAKIIYNDRGKNQYGGWVNDINKGKPTYSEETCPHNTVSTTVTIWTGLFLKPYLRSESSVITCPTHTTARIYLDPY